MSLYALSSRTVAGYCSAVQRQGEFAEGVAVHVGKRVEYFRTSGPAGKQSVQGLADRCTELGMPLDRSVIAKLEKGLRQTVTVGEILVLARALRVPPLLLVFPIGQQETMEVLPGMAVDVWDAAKWFTGEAPLALEWDEDHSVAQVLDHAAWEGNAAQLYREHDRLLNARRETLNAAGAARMRAKGAPDAEERDLHLQVAASEERHARELEQALRDHRAHMRRVGITPPALPTDLTHIDG